MTAILIVLVTLAVIALWIMFLRRHRKSQLAKQLQQRGKDWQKAERDGGGS